MTVFQGQGRQTARIADAWDSEEVDINCLTEKEECEHHCGQERLIDLAL